MQRRATAAAAAVPLPLKLKASATIAVEQTKKISEHGRKGELEDAVNMFDAMSHKNQVTWNAMLSVLVNTGHLRSALDLFDKMPKRNSRSYTSAISGLSYAGSVLRARSLFDSIPSASLNVFTWTAMISCYVQNGEPLEALRLFKHTYRSSNIKPNPHTFTVVLKACSSVQCQTIARQVHASIVKHLGGDGDASVFVTNSLLNVNAKLGNLADAEGIFSRMKHKDLATFNTMMDAYTHHFLIDKALVIFTVMNEKDTLSWNIVMLGLLESGRGEEALRMFAYLLRETVPNSSTITIALSCCAALATIELGRQVQAYTAKVGLLNTFVSNSLITMYSSCGLIEELEQVFDEMPARDVVSWNSMIQGLGQNGQARRALDMAGQALRSKIYSSNTFTAILTSCNHGGLVEEGMEYFNSMGMKYGIEPSSDHCICLIDVLGRAGKLREALSFLQERGLESNSVAWVTLLNCCSIHGESKIGATAAAMLQDLEPENVKSYLALASLYSRTGRIDESRRLLDLMRSMDLRKIPGCSWVIWA